MRRIVAPLPQRSPLPEFPLSLLARSDCSGGAAGLCRAPRGPWGVERIQTENRGRAGSTAQLLLVFACLVALGGERFAFKLWVSTTPPSPFWWVQSVPQGINHLAQGRPEGHLHGESTHTWR